MTGRPLFLLVDSTGGFIGRIAWINTSARNEWGEVSWLNSCWWGDLGIIRRLFGAQ
jgi:hypothetical protein